MPPVIAVDARHAAREPAHHRRGQHRKARHAREHEHAARPRRGIELRNAFDEIGAVGEIEIVDAERDRGPHHPIGIVAISLERPGGINDDVGRDRRELAFDIAVAIERRRHEPRRRSTGLHKTLPPSRASARR